MRRKRPSHKAVADTTTNTEKRTYAQTAPQTQMEEIKKNAVGGGSGKRKGPSPEVVEVSERPLNLPPQPPFVEDLSGNKEEAERERRGRLSLSMESPQTAE